MPRGAGKVLRVLEILPLGLNKSVYIVAIGSKVVALGVAEKSINLLLELDEATSRKMLEAVDVFPPVGKTGSTFSIAAWLRKLFPANPNASSPPEKELNSFRDSFQKYMERLSYLQKDAYVDDGAKNPEVSKEGKKNNGQKNGD